MGAMPGMDKEDDKGGKPKGIDLAIIMGGKPKGGAKDEPMGKPKEPDSDDELPAGFEEAFAEAFPDAAGDHDRMLALKRLIGTCMSSGDDY